MSRFGVIDVDTHVIEPIDLWTSRLPQKYVDAAPHVAFDESTGKSRWYVGRHKLPGEAAHSHAGWREFSPSEPPSLGEAHPGGHDATERLKVMDDHGIDVQVIYPNLLGFFGYAFLDLPDPELRLLCVQAFNDFQTEWCSVAPERLIPLAFLPWWDVEASVAELQRCADMGHRGMNWGQDFERLGLPPLADEHWDPVLSCAQDLDLPVSFHIGFGSHTEEVIEAFQSPRRDIENARDAVLFFLGNARGITNLILLGMCDRYPRLNFVSVESGFGYVPYLLEAMDWQYLNNRASVTDPLKMLPSEYFKRQIYATFWFESNLDRLLDLYPDNVMFESDFPHPTSLSPGPGSVAEDAKTTLARTMANVPDEVRRKVLHDNAARLYKLS